MQDLKKTKESPARQFNEVFLEFIQKNRVAVFAVTGIIVFLFIGAAIFLVVRENITRNALVQVEEYTQRLNALIFNINDEEYSEEVEALLSEMVSFAGNARGIAYSRAWSLIAAIYNEREDRLMTQEAWQNAARAGANTYLGPISLANAAAAAEEQGRLEEAIKLLEQALNHRFEFPAAPRAQFSVGRLHEQLGNYQSAIEAYRAVTINWAEIQPWHQFARNRIIAIEAAQ